MDNREVSIFYVGNNIDQYEYYAKYFDTISKNGKEFCNMNVYRGGTNFDGFVFEYKHASAENIKSLLKNERTVYTVNNNNGISDITKTDLVTGKVQELQCKAYKNRSWYNCDVDRYVDSGQSFVVTKNDSFGQKYVEKRGGEVQKSMVSKEQAQMSANARRMEAALTHNSQAPMIGKIELLKDQLMTSGAAGVRTGVNAAGFAVGISLGNNLCDFINGSQDIDDLIMNAAVDGGKALVGGTITGAASYVAAGMLANTVAFEAITTVSSFICNLGPISAIMSIGTGPLFLGGLALGLGIGIFKSIKASEKRFNSIVNLKSNALYEELMYFDKIYKEMDKKILQLYGLVDSKIVDGLERMKKAIQEDDFSVFSSGLNEIMNVFGKNVLFHDLDEFDEFFYDDDIALSF